VQAALTAVKNAPSWSGRRPSDKTIIEIFISTSQFYHWNGIFIKVANKSSDMVKWLRDEKALEAADVWGFNQTLFNLKNLDIWIKTDGRNITDKGKQKADGKRKRRAMEKGEQPAQKEDQEKGTTSKPV